MFKQNLLFTNYSSKSQLEKIANISISCLNTKFLHFTKEYIHSLYLLCFSKKIYKICLYKWLHDKNKFLERLTSNSHSFQWQFVTEGFSTNNDDFFILCKSEFKGQIVTATIFIYTKHFQFSFTLDKYVKNR